MKQSEAIRLDEETAARPLDNGQWYIFAYEDDEGETHEMIRAGHLVLSEEACINFAEAIRRTITTRNRRSELARHIVEAGPG